MSSYRITLTVGVLRPGVQPQAILPAAVETARARVTVESHDVGVVRGQARVTVRCTAESDEEAVDVARLVRAVLAGLADVGALTVARRSGARWHPIPPYW